MLTAQEASKLFSYSPDTGEFLWATKPGRGVAAGSAAGRITKDGYREIGIRGRLIGAHRLAWLISYGRWPTGEIDHINGVRSDNRIANLREVPRRINAHNLHKANRNNKTGFLGVHASRGKFRASIVHMGKTIHIGCYATAEEAHVAYIEAKRRLHEGCVL